MQKKMKYSEVFLMGFGFLGISLLWAIYNAYVPIFLQAGRADFAHFAFGGFGLSAAATGFVMSLDNIAAVFIQPWIGVKSDKTRTRFGRRIPYIMFAAPLTVAGFIAVPFAAKMVPPALSGNFSELSMPFTLMMLALGITLTAAAVYRTPAVALMPDIVVSKFRSQANGIINLMGGIGVVLGMFAGGILFDINMTMPFIVGGLVVLISSAVVVFAIKEPAIDEDAESAEKQPGLIDNLREVWHDDNKSVLFLLLAIFAWFVGYSALETFFTSYATTVLDVTPGKASQLFTIAGGTFLLAAVPAGYLAGKIGRKRTIISGLSAFFAAVLLISFTHNLTTVIVGLVIVGAAWALVNINSLPMVVDSVSQSRLGAYTGLYYFASMSASIIAPISIGKVVDIFGYRSMFGASAVALALAAIFLTRVTTGEIITDGE